MTDTKSTDSTLTATADENATIEIELEELPAFEMALMQQCGDADGPGWG